MSTLAATGQAAYVGVQYPHVGCLVAGLDSLANPTPPIPSTGGCSTPLVVNVDADRPTDGPGRQSPMRFAMRLVTAGQVILILLAAALALHVGALTLGYATRHQHSSKQAAWSNQPCYKPATRRLYPEDRARPPRRTPDLSPTPSRTAPLAPTRFH